MADPGDEPQDFFPQRHGAVPSRAVLRMEDMNRICDFLRRGHFFETATRQSGVPRGTAYQWLAQGSGRLVHRGLRPTPETEAFVEAVSQALVEAEDAALAAVLGGRPGWQSRAWYLERRFGERWGNRKLDLDAERRAGAVILELVEEMVNDPEADLTPEQRQAQIEVARRRLGEQAGADPDGL